MSEGPLQRVRIVFAVGEAIQYISHLDLLRAWERTLRRAGVPLAYSHGFSPHPRLVIAMPLPVGCTGAQEVIDAYLYESVTPTALIEALNGQMPEGLEVVAAGEVDLRGPAMPSAIAYAAYRIALQGIACADAASRADAFLAQEQVPVAFRGKRFDLRPLVERLEVEVEDGAAALEAVLLRLPSGRIGRPDVLLEALGLAAHARSIHRVRIGFDVPVL